MEKEQYEKELRQNEIDSIKADKQWREEFQFPMDEQEVVRRSIESLLVAAKVADMLSTDDAKAIKSEIKGKLSEFIGKLKPIK